MLFSACSYRMIDAPVSDNSTVPVINASVLGDIFLVDSIGKCDRFRPIFEKELQSHPEIGSTMDLSKIYSLIYQESACETRDELEQTFKDRNDSRETW